MQRNSLRRTGGGISQDEKEDASELITDDDTTSYVKVDEIYDDNSLKFNRANLTTLLRYITGNENAGVNEETMASISTMAENATTSADIREKVLTSTEIPKSNGQDVIVTLGGLDWQVVYLSKDNQGNNILTLWLANSTDTSSFSGYISDAPSVYPSNMYGTSYIRAVALNNGGKYAITEDELSEEHSKDATNKFARFTMENVEGSLTSYIVKPNEIEWQQYQSTIESNLNSTYLYPNDSLQDPTGKLEGEYYTSDYNYHTKPNYDTWGNDYIWLPSMTETGYTSERIGLWETSITQRANSGIDISLRSGLYFGEYVIYGLNSSGEDYTNNSVTFYFAVRPAFHLNLDAVYDNITLSTITLDAQNGSENTYIYQRYGVGFYADSETMEPITSIEIPTSTGHTFKGYYTDEDGSGTMVIDESGNTLVSNTFFQENRTIYALWQVNKYRFDVDGIVNNLGLEDGYGFYGFTYNIYRNGEVISSNVKDYAYSEDYGTEMTVEINSFPEGYYYDRMTCEQWDLIVRTESITVRVVDQVTKVRVYFYSYIYEITLKYGNGDTDSKLYLKYDVGYFKDEACNYELTEITAPTRTGYKFGGFYTGEDGSGTKIIDETGNIVAPANAFLNDTNLFAYWIPKNEANYDEENGYWYVEIGYFPQTKVSDSSLISSLDAERTNGNEISKTYTISGHTLKVYTFAGEEYAYLDLTGCYYKVEPVRYVLQSSSSLKNGFATENGSVTAVSEKVVFASVFQTGWTVSDCLGKGYANAQISTNVSEFLSNSLANGEYLNTPTYSITNFKTATGGKSSTNLSVQAIASNRSEIQSVFGDLSAEFSDLVADILGGYLFYWTRDVGSNLNNAQTISAGGVTGTQMKISEILGVRVTVNVKTLACL